MDAPLRIGISACLLGEEVRYDGGHKRDPWIAGVLGRLVEFVPVCPEVEAGLGTPRPPVRLERNGRGAVRLVEPRSGRDLTGLMERFAAGRARALEREALSGYILKSRSPSCGARGVEVATLGGRSRREGRGLFAAALTRRLPLLPVVEEEDLRDPAAREAFLERVLAGRRLRALLARRPGRADLERFHGRERYLLLARGPRGESALRCRIAAGGRREVLARDYAAGFAAALARTPTPARHAAVLRRAAGLLRGRLEGRERTALDDAVDGYRRGRVPREVPLDLLRRHARRHRVGGLLSQTWLESLPAALRGRPAPARGA